MQTGFTDRRHSPRARSSERIRIRPRDPLQVEKICNASNGSQNGIYFLTKTGSYSRGMRVFVTRNFRPDDPANQEEEAVVVRVESLGGGHVGVAIEVKRQPRQPREQRQPPKRVLFVCVGNTCRSLMAEALARHLAPDVIAASSAGVAPLGYVCPSTRAVLDEIGVSSAGQESKPLRAVDVATAHLLINMSGQPLSLPGTAVEDWPVADPFGQNLAAYRHARDEIKRRITEMAKRLRASVAAQPAPKR